MKQVGLPVLILFSLITFLIGTAVGARVARSPAAQLAVIDALKDPPQQQGEPARQPQSQMTPEQMIAAAGDPSNIEHTSRGGGVRLVRSDVEGLHLLQLKDRLQEIMFQEEVLFADLGEYTSDLNRMAPVRHPADSVNVLFRYAGQRGWVAEASHPALRGKSCVIFVGDRNSLPVSAATMRDARMPEHPGQVACDN